MKSVHLIYAHQRKRNTDSISSTRVAHCLNFVVKSVKHSLFCISYGISDQIFIALHLNILAPKFERAVGKAFC